MSSLGWYINRLRSMSLSEIIYRFRNKIQSSLEKYFPPLYSGPETSIKLHNIFFEHLSTDISQRHKIDLIKNADKIVNGNLSVFAINYNFMNTPNWNQDPKTKITAPLVFGKTLNYRDDSLVGDIKYLWEPNRHLHFPILACAYKLSKDKKYITCLFNHVRSWIDECPYMKGPQWTSSLELGIRLINWSLTWNVLSNSLEDLFNLPGGLKLKNDWLRSVYQHIHFINGHYSQFSSANNHLIGEAAGVYIGCITWPYWTKFKKIKENARIILEKESINQNGKDGVNLEQASSYQQFVLDFLIISGIFNKKTENNFSKEYWTNIHSMLLYVKSLIDIGGNIPMIGDADDGYVIKLTDYSYFCPFKSLLNTGSLLFNDFGIKYDMDIKSFFLLGTGLKNKLNISNQINSHNFFQNGGYYMLGSDLNTPKEVKLIVDCGPLGFKSIAAHGHADALSIYLSIMGREFFIDPGTYAYHTETKWRNYFRGTSAHNTVRIDKLDQSTIGGNFMWTQKANSQLIEYESNNEYDLFIGEHDGYNKLPSSSTHERKVEYFKLERKIVIEDYVYCMSFHEIEIFWHLSEKTTCILKNNISDIKNESVNIEVTFPKNMNIELYKGNSDIPIGWVSRKFDVKIPSYSIRCFCAIDSNTSFKTIINF